MEILLTNFVKFVSGIGFGMGTALTPSILHVHFKENFNRMFGITVSSGCIGALVLPVIADILLKYYGTSGALLILSGIILQCVPAAMLISKPLKPLVVSGMQIVSTIDSHKFVLNKYANHNEEVSSSEQLEIKPYDATIIESSTIPITIFNRDLTNEVNKSEITHINSSKNMKRLEVIKEKHQMKIPSPSAFRKFEIFIDPAYILILVSVGLTLVVITTFYTVIVDVCKDKSITEDVTMLMTFTFTDVLGRFSFGYIADCGCIGPLNLFALCYGSCGILFIGLTWFSGFYTVLILVAGFGTLMGGLVVLPVGIIANYVQKENLTIAFPSRYIVFVLLSFSQSPVIGKNMF